MTLLTLVPACDDSPGPRTAPLHLYHWGSQIKCILTCAGNAQIGMRIDESRLSSRRSTARTPRPTFVKWSL